MGKRQLGLMSNDQLEAERAEKIRPKQTRLGKTRLALVYGRQSTERQSILNRESKRDQCEEIIKYAMTDYEWPEMLIRAFYENEFDQFGNKLEKPKAASGRQDINLRFGLSEAQRLIAEDKAGALFVNDVSRLFRDPDMVSPAPFAELCKQHHCVIVTYDQEFDFNATARDDLKDFLEEAQNAADYLKTLGRTMQRRREKKGMRGGYAGHPLPTGFMLDKKRDNYLPNPAWSGTVAWLTRRFRELDADITALHNEIHGVPIFCELPPDIVARVGKIQLQPVSGGYTIASRGSLVYLLTNPANIGHRVYKRRIVKWDAHPAIVDREDYDYALAHLGKTDLNGNVIEREKRTPRYTQGPRREGLLAGTRSNGKPIVSSTQGNVYIFQQQGSAAYTIKDLHYDAETPYSGSIALNIVDAAVSQRLEDRLHDLMYSAEGTNASIAALKQAEVVGPGANELVDRVIANKLEEQAGARAILDHASTLRLQVVGSLRKINETIADIENKIAFNQREYNAAKDVMSDEDIREHFASLARMRSRLTDLREKKAQAAQVDKDIVAVKSRLERTREEWQTMTLEQKRAFIRLITQEVRLDSLSDRLMRLTLVWHPVLAGEEHTEFTILEKSKGSGANWTEDEDAILHELYPQVQRSDILIALPRRSWVAIKSRAKALDVSRYTYATGEFQIPDTLALEDWILSQESGIEPGEWTSEATVKLNGTVRATIPVQ